MEIGFFCYSLGGAGPRVRARNLIDGLADRTPHTVTLVTSQDETFSHDDVNIHRLLSQRALLNPKTVVEIRDILGSCDVIHVPVNFYQLAYISALGIQPRVAGAGIQHGRKFRFLTRLIGLETMIETHEYVASKWERSGVNATYIYPAVDTDQFKPRSADERTQFRDDLGIPHNHDIILFVGELKPLKGAHLMASVADHYSNEPVSVVVVGDGQQRELFETNPNVVFEGFVENHDLPPYYDLADITVVPSKQESFSIVSLESVASGTPVITTTKADCTMSRLFRERGTYCWTNRTPTGIVKAIEQLRGESDLYEAYINRGFETIDEMGLSVEDAINKYHTVYKHASE